MRNRCIECEICAGDDRNILCSDWLHFRRHGIIILMQFALCSLVHCWQLVSVWKSFIARLYKIKGFSITSFIDSLIDLKYRSRHVNEPKMVVIPRCYF